MLIKFSFSFILCIWLSKCFHNTINIVLEDHFSFSLLIFPVKSYLPWNLHFKFRFLYIWLINYFHKQFHDWTNSPVIGNCVLAGGANNLVYLVNFNFNSNIFIKKGTSWSLKKRYSLKHQWPITCEFDDAIIMLQIFN